MNIPLHQLDQAIITMVREFQCPGCSAGSDPKTCEAFEYQETQALNKEREMTSWGSRCKNHTTGTIIQPGGKVNLGMPKGFNKVPKNAVNTNIRLHASKETYHTDHLNVPVWAMEHDGYLFVRTFCPRLDTTYVDVIKDGTLELVPKALNVAEFVDSLD